VAGSLNVVPADLRYPFNVWGTNLSGPLQVAYNQLNMVKWAVTGFVTEKNRLPVSWEELADSEHASYLRLRNAYHNRPARVSFSLPPPEAERGQVFGDIFALPYTSGKRHGLELRAYVPPDPDRGEYLWQKPRTLPLHQGIERDLAAHSARRQAREPKDRVVSIYCDRLRSSASSIARTIVPPVHYAFGVPLSLRVLEDFWWEIDPSAIVNPYTGKVIREVALESPSPGEVTFLPVQLGLDPIRWFKGPSEFRPALYPLQPVVICYDGNAQPIYSELLAFASRNRPNDLPPIPETLPSPARK
jgi:hypothetical protein